MWQLAAIATVLILLPATADAVVIPDWIKNEYVPHVNGTILELEFVQLVQLLMDEQIITPSNDTQNMDYIPNWTITTAIWWSQDIISDDEFVNAIQYLITTGALIIGVHPDMEDVVPAAEPPQDADNIPGWVGHTVQFWVDGLIPDSEFAATMQFLVNHDVLTLPPGVPQQTVNIPDSAREVASQWSSGMITDDEFIEKIQHMITTGTLTIGTHPDKEDTLPAEP